MLADLFSLVLFWFDIKTAQVGKQECGWGWITNNKRWSGGMRQRQFRLFGQLNVVSDLQLIRFLCSACGNALHVVTAWKNRVVMDGGLAGGFLCVRPCEWGEIHGCAHFVCSRRRGVTESSVCCAVALGALWESLSSHLALTIWRPNWF